MADPFPWPPYPLDMTMRPLKNVAPGGVFVTGTSPTAMVHADVLRAVDRAEWKKVAEAQHIYPQTLIHAGAFGMTGGRPTFVLAGEAFRLGTPGSPSHENRQQLIITSHDGSAWTTTRGSPPTQVYLMAWDEQKKKFYAQAFSAVNDTVVVLESVDGLNWNTVASMSAFGNTTSPLLTATGTPLITDNNGDIVPNGGIFGWNGSNIWIAPAAMKDVYRGRAASAGKVEIITKTVNPGGGTSIARSTVSVPVQYVMTVAYASGVWKVGGYTQDDATFVSTAVIAKSTNNGRRWAIDYISGGGQVIECLVGGQSARQPADVFA